MTITEKRTEQELEPRFHATSELLMYGIINEALDCIEWINSQPKIDTLSKSDYRETVNSYLNRLNMIERKFDALVSLQMPDHVIDELHEDIEDTWFYEEITDTRRLANEILSEILSNYTNHNDLKLRMHHLVKYMTDLCIEIPSILGTMPKGLIVPKGIDNITTYVPKHAASEN